MGDKRTVVGLSLNGDELKRVDAVRVAMRFKSRAPVVKILFDDYFSEVESRVFKKKSGTFNHTSRA